MNTKKLFPLLIGVLVVWAALTYVGSDDGRLDADQGTHFAFADTARVTRIRIADARGNTASLERTPEQPLGLWKLNDTHWVGQDQGHPIIDEPWASGQRKRYLATLHPPQQVL